MGLNTSFLECTFRCPLLYFVWPTVNIHGKLCMQCHKDKHIQSRTHQTNKFPLVGKSTTDIWPQKTCSRGQSAGLFTACPHTGWENEWHLLAMKSIPLSAGSHIWHKYLNFYLNGTVWSINLSACKHILYRDTETVSLPLLLLLDPLSIHCVEIDSGLWCIIVVSANQITAVHERNPPGSPKETADFSFTTFLRARYPRRC